MAELRNLIVAGATSLSGTLNVTGNTTVGGTLNVTGNTTVGGTLSISNQVVVNNPSVTTSSGIPQTQDAKTTSMYNDAFAIRGASNDGGWMRFFESNNDGSLEIATGDDGTEPIYCRQYNTSGGVVRTATILDGSGNTSFPGNVYIPGQVYKEATSISWYQGRSYAPFKTTTVAGYFPLASIKTTNGSWDIGHYSTGGWHDKMTFTYVDDSNFNVNNNAATTYTLDTNGYFSGSASYATSSGSASYATSSGSASYATSSGSASVASGVSINNTITYGASTLQYAQFHGSSNNPFTDWFSHLYLNHGNNGGYLIDVAFCFHSHSYYIRRLVNGSWTGWAKIQTTEDIWVS